MKYLQNMIACSMVCIAMFPMAVQAKDTPEDGCYYTCSIDTTHSNFDTGDWKYKMTTKNNLTFLLEETAYAPFLVLDGMVSAVPIVVQDGTTWVSLKEFCKEMHIPYQQTQQNITISYQQDSIVLDTVSMTMQKNKQPLHIKPQTIKQDIYVPIRAFCDLLQIPITYTKEGLMPLYCPSIDVDQRPHKITKEQAMQIAKKNTEQSYQVFLTENPDIDKTAKQIKQKINGITYMGESASFWIYRGPYILLVDKATGIPYYKTQQIHGGHGSYIEAMYEINPKDGTMFENF